MAGARHFRAGGEECQLHLREIEGLERPHPHLATTKGKALPCRLAAGQKVQILHRELTLFEQFDQRFTDIAGGTDQGDIDGLTHGRTCDA